MNFKSASKKRRDVEITVIPLIDLFMVVLTFFILTTTFNRESVFFVDLPETNDAQALGKDVKLVQLSVSPNGDLSMNNQKTNIAGIKEYLESLSKAGKKDLPVLIRADQNVMHGKVVEVIDVVQASGFSNVGIATREKK
jgi:biopolymer transport protein ExbD